MVTEGWECGKGGFIEGWDGEAKERQPWSEGASKGRRSLENGMGSVWVKL